VQLEAAGYTTLLQAWDFRPGSNFVHQMQRATSTAARTIAVLSPAYFGSAFGEAEWRAAFVILIRRGGQRPWNPRGCARGALEQRGTNR
jgi:TIR domain